MTRSRSRRPGGATLLGLDLSARVLFLLPTGAGQPTCSWTAGSLTGLGVPITSGHVVFAWAAVPDFEVEPGLALDIPQGITGIGSIDLGQPVADLLNQAFSPPTPILPRVTVTLSFGAAIEIKAAIDLGGDGATLFMGCPGGGTGCSPTAPTTTRLAPQSAFIRLVLGGSGGFSIGFGGDGTLNLPPAEPGGRRRRSTCTSRRRSNRRARSDPAVLPGRLAERDGPVGPHAVEPRHRRID